MSKSLPLHCRNPSVSSKGFISGKIAGAVISLADTIDTTEWGAR
jgi:hypothetical protein